MAETLKLRPSVAAFAQEMERKLRTHDGDRGDRGWGDTGSDTLLLCLEGEVQELTREVRSMLPGRTTRITLEAADVANFAMMLADAHGDLGVPWPEDGSLNFLPEGATPCAS